MGTKNRVTYKQSGFSLVELMVVVAIIGILATIAVPRVTKFIAKSRQSEAQVNLSSIYTLNANFFTEFQGYTSNFVAMGYEPRGNLYYNTGWSQNYVPNNYIVLKGTTPPATAINTKAVCSVDGTGVCTTLRGATGVVPANIAGTVMAAGSSSVYTAQSRAMLVSGNNEDIWTIDQDKRIRNTSDGTAPVAAP